MHRDYKKGALPVTWTITIVLLIIGFLMVLLIYSQFFDVQMIDKEVCHKSLLARATLAKIPVAGGATREYIPLSCQTQKMCFTGKLLGGDCNSFEGEKSVKNVRITNGDSGLNQIQKAYAQEILDCWTMLGEGKISLYTSGLSTRTGFSREQPHCVICSRIAIDAESLDKVKFSEMDLNKYMMTHYVSGQEKTYFNYLTNDGKIGVSVNETALKDAEGVELTPATPIGTNDDSFKNQEVAIVFMQINQPPTWGEAVWTTFTNVGLPAAVGFTVIPGAKLVVGKVAGAVGGTYSALILAGAIVIGGGAQAIQVYRNSDVTVGYCGDISMGEDSKSGCSVVRVIPYDATGITKYCSVIESIP